MNLMQIGKLFFILQIIIFDVVDGFSVIGCFPLHLWGAALLSERPIWFQVWHKFSKMR
jgi:hypothetical protein